MCTKRIHWIIWIVYQVILGAQLLDALVIKSRIFGGESAYEKQFLYQVSICSRQANVEHHICGGAIISEIFIITAAHCINPNGMQNYSILVGTPYRYEGDDYRIVRTFIHEKFNLEKVLNDIGLIQLEKAIEFSSHVASIPLNTNFIQENVTAIVSGWGDSGPQVRSIKSFNGK